MGDWQREVILRSKRLNHIKLPVSSGLSFSMLLNAGIHPHHGSRLGGPIRSESVRFAHFEVHPPCSRGKLRGLRRWGPNPFDRPLDVLSSGECFPTPPPKNGGGVCPSRKPRMCRRRHNEDSPFAAVLAHVSLRLGGTSPLGFGLEFPPLMTGTSFT